MDPLCDSCLECRGCPDKGEYHKRYLFGGGLDGVFIDCRGYRARWFRGIEGVAA